MDLHNNNQYEYSAKDDNEKIEPGELLEDNWFFGNLLQRKNSRMLRSLSDPCPSSDYTSQQDQSLPGKSYEETYESINKQKQESDSHRGKRSNRKKASSRKSLIRTPSLPTSLETEETEDEEIEFSMGKLIRQASMKNYSDTLPPRTHSTKGSILTPSYSTSGYRSRRKPELETIKMEGLEEIRPQRRTNQLRTQTSLIDFESEELKGFKDLGFDFDEKDSNPNVINTITTGLREKKKIEEDEEKSTVRRSYLSEVWGPRSYSAPPVPKWGGGGVGSTTEDMKAQIKFWARAVASNVRQEC